MSALPQKEWVIDTNVLVKADEFSKKGKIDGDYYSSIQFITRFMDKENHVLCVDQDGLILEEYRKNIELHFGSFISAFWKLIEKQNRISYKDVSQVPRSIESDLKKLKFDEDDIIFVKVSYVSTDRRIVTTDLAEGDYDKIVREYLNRWGITVYAPTEAKKVIERE